MMLTSRSSRRPSRLRAALSLALFSLLLAAVPAARAVDPDQILRLGDHPGTPTNLQVQLFYRTMVVSGDWLAFCIPSTTDQQNPTSGRVLLWKRVNGLWQPRQVLQSYFPAPVLGDTFGYQVAMQGRRMLVSCQISTSAASVQSFVLSGDTWIPDGRLILPGKDFPNVSYGYGIAVHGDLAAVGTPSGRLKGMDNVGWVDLFERKTSGWVHKVRLTDTHALGTTPGEPGEFGGDLILTPDSLYVQVNRQRVALFQKTGTTWAKSRDLRVPPESAGDFSNYPIMKLSGSSLFMVGEVRAYEFSIPRDHARIDHEDVTLGYLQGDIHGNTSVNPFGDSVALFHRQPDLAWGAVSMLETPYHGLNWVIQAVLTPQQMLLFGVHPTEGYQVRAFARSTASNDAQVQIDFSGPVTTPATTTTVPTATVLNAGDIRQGVEAKPLVTFTAFQAGDQPVTLTLGTSGDTTDFTLSATSLTLQPGQKATASVNFKAATLGAKHLQLTFTRQGQGSPISTYEINATSVSPAGALTFSQQPASGLYTPYQFPGLHAKVTGTGPITYRWLKDGKPVTTPGATSPSFWPTTGGRYQLEATNPHSKVLSNTAYLGFLHIPTPQVFVRPGTSAKCTVLVSAPAGTSVQWNDFNTNTPLENGDFFSGVTTTTLTAKIFLEPQILVDAMVTMPIGPGEDPLTAYLTATLWAAPLHSIQGFDPGSEFTVGTEVQAGVLYTLEASGYGSPLFTITGLPPGLQADNTGTILGRPTTPGKFSVKVILDCDGMVVTKTLPMTIHPDGPAPGIYWGSITRSASVPEIGALILDANISGTYSGNLHLGATRTPTAGTLARTSGANTADKPLPIKIQGQPHVYWLRATTTPNTYLVLIRPEGTAIDGPSALEIGTVSLIKPRDLPVGNDITGTYNFGLQNLSDDPNLLGHGWGTFKAANTGIITLTGQMPDGSSITGSGWMSPLNDHLYLYQVDPATKAVLHGDVDRLNPAPVVRWERPATGKGRLYPGGISSRALHLLASRHVAVKNTALLPTPNMQFVISAPEGGIPSTAVTLTSLQTVQIGTGIDANPLALKLAITPATGLITGQFIVKKPDPGNPAKTITRTIPYKGILLQAHGVGLGCFQIPQLPATPATPIHSGSFQLQPVEN